MFSESPGKGFFEISHKRVEAPSEQSYINHVHSYCELLLFVGGNANFNIDGTVYSPSFMDLFLIPDAKYHYITPKGGVPYENYVIGFDKSLISKERYEKIFSPPYVISIRDNKELCDFFTRLDFFRKALSDDDFSECSRLLALELLIYLGSIPKSNLVAYSYSNSRISDIISVIEESITEKLNAEIIAKKLFLSKSYIQNVFSRVMHIGIKEYINQRKIFCAETELKGGMSPALVAEKYGFSDYSSFYRAYKKIFHRSPKKQTE